MRSLLSFVACLLIASLSFATDAPLIYSGNVDFQGKATDQGGSPQSNMSVKAGNGQVPPVHVFRR